jgi:VanZ family protein
VLKKTLFFLALFWGFIIAFLCLIKSSDVPQVRIPGMDKVVHAFFYFVFTILWFLFFKKHFNSTTISKALVISFTFSLSFGILIEILQRILTKTRNADVFDVMANATGATLAIILIVLLDKYKKLDRI